MIATERANALLGLVPERDQYEAYSVGRLHTLPPSAVFYICIACRHLIGGGARVREIRTRTWGTDWTNRMVHFVHETCWLKARTVAGVQDFLAQRAPNGGTVRP